MASIEADSKDGELVRSGELSWVNDSAIHSKSLDNNSSLTLEGTEYRVSIPNSSDPSRATLRERQDSNGSGEPASRRLGEGDTVRFRNNSTTIASIPTNSLVLQWRTPKTMSVSLGETEAIKTTLVRGGFPEQMQFPSGGSNVTLNGETYTVHYPDNSTVQLSTDRQGYQRQLRQVRHRTERIAGLWGISILSTITALLLLGLSCLPTTR